MLDDSVAAAAAHPGVPEYAVVQASLSAEIQQTDLGGIGGSVGWPEEAAFSVWFEEGMEFLHFDNMAAE